jgi:myo-inositol 2-dehydrogenase/D-chiro-inositol 1-dehydrogenase
MNKYKPFRLAIIGAGGIGSIHIRNSIETDDINLVGICELDKERAKSCIKDQFIPIVENINDLIKLQPEGIVIASSTTSHGQIAKAIIKAKIPFLCEKPLASDLNQAKEIANYADKQSVYGAMAFNRRFYQKYSEMRKAIHMGEIGTPETLHVTSRSATPPSAKFISTSGGLFGEKGSHFYDLIRWMLNSNTREVFAYGDALFDPEFKAINQPDTAVILMRLDNGVLCSCNFSWRSGYGHDERLEIAGSKGMIKTVQRTDTAEQGFGKGAFFKSGNLPNWHQVFKQTYLDELNVFIAEIRNGDGETLPTLFDGFEVQKIADAIDRSFRTKKSIILDGP